MKSMGLNPAIKAAADPERAGHFFELLAAGEGKSVLGRLTPGAPALLATLFSGSQALGNLLVAHPEWIEHLEPEALRFPRREQGLRKEVEAWLQPLIAARDYPGALRRLREFKQKEMLRIGARDLARLGGVGEITREISDVADVCLGVILQVCLDRLRERHGRPWHQDAANRWQPTGFCVFGMGKLGGQELNYSSDVDVLFVYTEEGQVFKDSPTPRVAAKPLLSNHQFFNRLAEAFIAEVSNLAEEGMLFRIDLRLRPEGDAGPLTRSVGSYENYYAQWGQTWERMMLIKARRVAGDEALGGEFLETIQPFRYPRAINEGVLHEIAAMKDRMETEVLRGDELERNVKLGRGGIREIEFIVQSQQLLHAGRQPFLQGASTLPCLEKLAQYNLIPGADARALRDAYCFLRDVEHRLQMEENLQTHTIPAERAALGRLAKLMGFQFVADFESARRRHTARVRRVFAGLMKTEAPSRAADGLPQDFEASASLWNKLLVEHSFRDPDKAFRLLREFVQGPGYVHVSRRTAEMARKLVTRVLNMCPRIAGGPVVSGPGAAPGYTLSDPDRVVMRLDSFIAAYGARGVLFELWSSNPAIFEMLVLLFDRSEFLAELAIRNPDMVDELVTSGRLRQRKTSQETLRDLRHGMADKDQSLWLRRYHQTELMRIGLRDILGLADFEQYLQELSALAEACLQYALEVVMERHRLKTSPFVIVGLGKLGGAEIDYGSDLDVIFVADSKAKNLAKPGRMAVEIMDLLSTRTEMGIVFHTDARLRPDGEKGLLVNTLKAYEEYYLRRARLWEIQSLTRARPVAGDWKLGGQFQKLAARLTDFSGMARTGDRPVGEPRHTRGKAQALLRPACYTEDWKRKIHQMRMRIEKERTPPGKDDLAIKTGKGGLMDAEFVAQAMCLENGWQEANTLRALERANAEGVLPQAGTLISNYRKLRRVEGILRRWSYEGETVLPDDPAPFYRVSVRCDFPGAEEFRAALSGWRKAIRAAYQETFGS